MTALYLMKVQTKARCSKNTKPVEFNRVINAFDEIRISHLKIYVKYMVNVYVNIVKKATKKICSMKHCTSYVRQR